MPGACHSGGHASKIFKMVSLVATKGMVGRGTKSSQGGKGCYNISNISSSREGGRGPNNAFAKAGSRGRRNKRRRHGPTNCIHTTKAPTPSRAGRAAEEDQELDFFH